MHGGWHSKTTQRYPQTRLPNPASQILFIRHPYWILTFCILIRRFYRCLAQTGCSKDNCGRRLGWKQHKLRLKARPQYLKHHCENPRYPGYYEKLKFTRFNFLLVPRSVATCWQTQALSKHLLKCWSRRQSEHMGLRLW